MLSFCVFVILSLHCVISAEPMCSKFHYEEQILERVIKSEFLMQDFQKQFASLVDKVTSDMASFKKDIGTLRSDWKAFSLKTTQSVSTVIEDMQTRQREMETNVTEKLQTLERIQENIKESMKTPHVSFRARAPTDMTPSSGSRIIYKTAEENLGSGYDASTGVFTAPVSGLYSFAINLCSQQGDALDVVILKDGGSLVGTRLIDSTYYYCATLVGHAVLKQGDGIWAHCVNGGKLYDAYGNYWNTFSGLLVHQ